MRQLIVQIAEQYGFGIAKGKDGEVIGYYTKGQVAQPFMYPAFAELKDDVTQEIKAALEKDLKKKYLKQLISYVEMSMLQNTKTLYLV